MMNKAMDKGHWALYYVTVDSLFHSGISLAFVARIADFRKICPRVNTHRCQVSLSTMTCTASINNGTNNTYEYKQIQTFKSENGCCVFGHSVGNVRVLLSVCLSRLLVLLSIWQVSQHFTNILLTNLPQRW